MKWHRRIVPSPSALTTVCPARPAAAGVAGVVHREQRVDRREPGHVLGGVIPVRPLEGVAPEVDAGREFPAERVDLIRVLLQPDDADAVPHAGGVQLAALGEEPVAGRLGRVVRTPQPEPPAVASADPVEPARQVRLGGRLVDVRQVRQPDQGLAVGPADQRLAPGGEQDGDPVLGVLGGNPVDEAVEGRGVGGQFGAGLAALGEGAVIAAVVATGQGAAVENGGVHGRWMAPALWCDSPRDPPNPQ